jgi:hypothetical protein
MRIRELRAEGWRNLEPLTLVPGERLSVLYGDNGQGKTNVIEAAYYLAVLRSFRTSRAEDLIRRGQASAPTPATATATATARLRAEILHRGARAPVRDRAQTDGTRRPPRRQGGPGHGGGPGRGQRRSVRPRRPALAARRARHQASLSRSGHLQHRTRLLR